MNVNLDEVGRVADKIDGLLCALELPDLPPELHLSALRELLPELSARLKLAVIAECGENPWDGSPFNPATQGDAE